VHAQVTDVEFSPMVYGEDSNLQNALHKSNDQPDDYSSASSNDKIGITSKFDTRKKQGPRNLDARKN
jgi:hypothetical protein